MVEVFVKKRLKKEKINLNCKFSLEKGEIITIYGKADSGNIELLDLIEGNLTPDEGYIKDSEMNQDLNIVAFGENFKYITNKSIKNNIYATAGKKNRKFADEVVEHLGLKKVEKLLPSALPKREYEKFILAMCIVKKPDVLVLNKLYNSFAFDVESQISYFLEKWSMAVISVTDNFKNIPKLASKLLFIHNGEINNTIMLKEGEKTMGMVL